MALFPKREEMEGIDCEEILRFVAMIGCELRKYIGHELHRTKMRIDNSLKICDS